MLIDILNELVKEVDDFQLNKLLLKAFQIDGIDSNAEFVTDTAMILNNSHTKIDFIDLPNLRIESVQLLRDEILVYDINMLHYIQQFKNFKVQKLISNACRFDLDILRSCETKLQKINEILQDRGGPQPLKLLYPAKFEFPYLKLLQKLNLAETSLKTMIKSNLALNVNCLRKSDSVLSVKLDEITKNDTENAKHSMYERKISEDRAIVNKWKSEVQYKQEVAKKKSVTQQNMEFFKKKVTMLERKERVDFRTAKLDLKKIKAVEYAEECELLKSAKENVLQSIRDTVKITGERNTTRTTGYTENWTNKFKPQQKLHHPLVLTTYNNDQLFENPTFTLLHKLHDKGLTKTGYAGQLLKGMSK